MGTGVPARSSGDQTVNYLRAPIDFTLGLTATKVVGTLPANCVVLRAYIVVTTAFNAGTTNTMSIGTAASSTAYSTAISLATAGLIAGSSLATATTLTPAVDTQVIATNVSSGTAATAGAGIVVVEYLPVS